MPAVTANPLRLPRVAPPAVDHIDRPVRFLTTAPSGFEAYEGGVTLEKAAAWAQ